MSHIRQATRGAAPTTSSRILRFPGDPAWDAARRAAGPDARPAAVAFPETAGDLAVVLDYANELGLEVAFGATGAGPLTGAILVETALLDRG